MAQQDVKSEDWGEPISLDGRVHLYPSRMLPEYNTIGATAMAARFTKDLTQDLFALVCDKGFFPRIEHANAMKMAASTKILGLRDAGVVNWRGINYFCFVYEKPLAPPYWKLLNEVHSVMTEDTVNHSFIAPLVQVLVDHQNMGIMHGSIRPTNIFWREGSTTAPQLGDALTSPAGVGQPVVFETIERAMCDPLARGTGLHSDDCYAFGVTLAFILLGENPVAGMTDEQVMNAKLDKGTFNVLIGSRKLQASHIELLRGLLADDVRQRWTAEDIEQWMSGRRLTPKHSDAGRRATRFFEFAGKKYWLLRPLVADLAKKPSEAVHVIEDGSLEKWLVRSLGEPERVKEFTETIAELKESSNAVHYEDQIVTRACIVLDRFGPIRYRGLSIMPSGIAPYLAHVVMKGQNLQVISEVITNQFVTLWVNVQKDMKVDLVPLAQQLERMRAMMERSSLGHGIERVLYELNQTIPCLSSVLRNDYVVTLRAFLPAMERVASSSSRPSEPMDRHIAAFLIVRDKRGEAMFAAMDSGAQQTRRGLAMLSLYADLQYRFGPAQMPHLARWFIPLIEGGFNRFISKPFREKVRRQTKEAADKGDLVQMLKDLDDPRRVTGDEQNFLQARLMYREVKQELESIDKAYKNRETVIRDIGCPVAATAASICSIILIALMFGRTLIYSMLG